MRLKLGVPVRQNSPHITDWFRSRRASILRFGVYERARPTTAVFTGFHYVTAFFINQRSYIVLHHALFIYIFLTRLPSDNQCTAWASRLITHSIVSFCDFFYTVWFQYEILRYDEFLWSLSRKWYIVCYLRHLPVQREPVTNRAIFRRSWKAEPPTYREMTINASVHRQDGFRRLTESFSPFYGARNKDRHADQR